MNYLIPIAEFAQYLVFSILVGSVVLQFVPETKKPKIELAKSVYLLCCLGIIIFSFVPLLQVILFFKESVGITTATLSVLTDFQIGRAWIAICVLSLLVWIMIYFNRDKIMQALCLILMIVAVGSASHVASLSFVSGSYTHSIHFLMVTIWVGVLLHVAWFSKNQTNWASFLKWFTPLASFCVLIILISGFILMFFVDQPKEYINSWAIPYGRMLLLKHISIVPVITFAIINGILAKKTTVLSNFDPRPWVKGESLLLMIVFYCTAVMGTLSPPHEVERGLQSQTKPTWIEWILAKNELAGLQIELSPTLPSILLIIMSFIFLIMVVVSFRKVPPIVASILGVSFIITFYLGLMFSVILNY
jgi:copper resistance protein D